METNKPIIKIDALEIGYQRGGEKKQLINSINLQAKSGELIALIGPNGVGKSTFLKTLCKLQPALSGRLFLKGKELQKLSSRELATQVSLVSTDMYRTANLTVFDLVALGRYPYSGWYGSLQESDKHIVLDQLDKVGMLDYVSRQVTELSDGEYQRIMIARALAQDTPVIILDEPTAFLDLPNKFSIVNLLWDLTRVYNKTIIFSTHDLNIAMQYADLFWLFKPDGVLTGAPEDLLLEGDLARLFAYNNVIFDAESSQFKVIRESSKNICVLGDQTGVRFTKLALNRLGFATDCNKSVDASVQISIKDNKTCWELSGIDGEYEFYSISSLQNKLKEFV